MKEPKNLPQTVEEMATEIAVKRDNPSPKARQFYKAQSDAHRNEMLSATVSRGAQELLTASSRDKITLSDTDAVKQQAFVYLTTCQESGTLPTLSGLARALGYSRQALYDAMEKRSNPEVADFLEIYRDLCSDLLSESALANNVNFTYGIFLQKALFGLRESVEIIARPAEPLGGAQNMDALSQRYVEALPAMDEETEN